VNTHDSQLLKAIAPSVQRENVVGNVEKACIPGWRARHFSTFGKPVLIASGNSSRYKEATMWQLCKEFLLFLKQEKKWWLIPLMVVFLLLAALIFFSASPVLAPFMYPFM